MDYNSGCGHSCFLRSKGKAKRHSHGRNSHLLSPTARTCLQGFPLKVQGSCGFPDPSPLLSTLHTSWGWKGPLELTETHAGILPATERQGEDETRLPSSGLPASSHTVCRPRTSAAGPALVWTVILQQAINFSRILSIYFANKPMKANAQSAHGVRLFERLCRPELSPRKRSCPCGGLWSLSPSTTDPKFLHCFSSLIQ